MSFPGRTCGFGMWSSVLELVVFGEGDEFMPAFVVILVHSPPK